MAPAQELGAGAVVVFLEEGLAARSAGRASGGAAPLWMRSQRLRLTTGVSVSSKRWTAPAWRSSGSVAQREIELGVVEVLERVVRRDADVDVGWLRWNASIRGSSQSEPNEAKVVTLTRRRLRARRMCWTLVSSLASSGSTARSSVCPSGVICTWRVPRVKSWRAELVLEALDLAADRRLRDVELLGRGAEVERPRDRLEGAQVGQRERPLDLALMRQTHQCATSSFHWIYLGGSDRS